MKNAEIDNRASADQREDMGFEAAQNRLGMTRCPFGRHRVVPFQCSAFKGTAFDCGLRLGLVFGLYGVDAFRQHPLDLQALVARIGEADHGVVAEGGQSFTTIRFYIPETPAFAAIGLD
ncbi:hypothetical protein HK44_019375 [Pseudomonas fluorescens HK44]|uniref:Uncharacterized protein n=1 Tax=Pseudomonas fluorescens HK44 TaxID=1042209 RepID=A0A010T0Y1_PSEFL|nr:hypothetical protein HK44_019375 [Pseudomonas fluorescens HK44]